MRKRFMLLMVTLAAMVVVLGGQQSPQTPSREFTNSVGMKFVRIDPGSFKMGWEGHGPIHDVALSKGYYLQATEVTQAQWQEVMGPNPNRFQTPDRPVYGMSWDEIQGFLEKLNTKEKDTRYRLPTEAEWEYACRAGGQEPDEAPNLDNAAWWGKNSEHMTHPVGHKKANPWGLYDMRGNVDEWVQDWYGAYSAERQVDTPGPPSGDKRVVRGGSFLDDKSDGFRCASRDNFYPDERWPTFGFRCSRTF